MIYVLALLSIHIAGIVARNRDSIQARKRIRGNPEFKH
jgi:hypothetical protein